VKPPEFRAPAPHVVSRISTLSKFPGVMLSDGKRGETGKVCLSRTRRRPKPTRAALLAAALRRLIKQADRELARLGARP
jgi:hypothetical protein